MTKPTRTSRHTAHGAILLGILTPHPTRSNDIINVTPSSPPAHGVMRERATVLSLPATSPPAQSKWIVVAGYGLAILLPVPAAWYLVSNPTALIVLGAGGLVGVGMWIWSIIAEAWQGATVDYDYVPCCVPSREMME